MPLVILTMLRAGWALRRDSQVTSIALLPVIAIISGTGFYSIVEGLRFVDALYFSVVTLTTVGYGDFAPETDAGKLFTAVYVLVGVGIVLAFITTVAKTSQMPLLHAPKSQPTRSDGLDHRVDVGMAALPPPTRDPVGKPPRNSESSLCVPNGDHQ
jgi:voltage-gated potassium channel